MAHRGRRVARIYTLLNLLAATVWTFVLLEWCTPISSRLVDTAAFVGPIVLFFAIPAGALAILLTRRLRVPPPERRLLYVRLSKLFLAVSWLPCCLPVLFLALVTEPWPLSLRQGPDTEFARERFESVFGFAPPADVEDLYCRERWEFGDGTFHRFRFATDDATLPARLAAALGLAPAGDDPRAAWPRESGAPRWWPERDAVAPRAAWTETAGRRARLFVGADGRSVYFVSLP